ncbi:hypothetical protein BRADI_5g11962v3 [Brachypodium distachyon]|uniref:Uncharacterized protein n=1 Tax=Brachypodium distachyon TaxID=15368 RepID=A0A0Q3P2J9_BRADI|nr:hypothetical protein BRADI_5g11962v3 [Brachypodium distachyon]
MALDSRTLPATATACDVLDFSAARAPPLSGNRSASSTERGDFEGAVPIDLAPLNDERRMKEELVAWAKTVASMAIRASMQC